MLYYDAQLFTNLFLFQLSRYDISFAGIYSLFEDPLLVDWWFIDGWIFMGWFSLMFILKDYKKHLFLVIPVISYLILFMFAIPNEASHGWYRYPFYPFLISSLGIVLFQEYKNMSLLIVFVGLFVGLSLLSNTWQGLFGFSYGVLRLFILFFTGSMFIPLWFKKYSKYSRLIILLWLLLMIAGNIVTVIYMRA